MIQDLLFVNPLTSVIFLHLLSVKLCTLHSDRNTCRQSLTLVRLVPMVYGPDGWGYFGGGGGGDGQLVQLPDGRVIPRGLLMQLLHQARQEQESSGEDEEEDQGGGGCQTQ